MKRRATWQDSINAPVSAQGEYAAKKFYGDPKLAAAYLPVAYALLGGVKNQMAFGGIGFGHRTVELKDGTRIRVIRNGEQNLVMIDVSIPTQRMMGEESVIVHGFVFRPYVDGKTAYKGFPPHALMEIAYDGKSQFDLKIIAPESKGYGNQFAFHEMDVYSWRHSEAGDGETAAKGGDAIYRNGGAWHSVGYKVIGLQPVTVKIDDVNRLLFLVATASFMDEVSFPDIRLGCYEEIDGKFTEIGKSIELLPDKTLDYVKTYWPCRFKNDGSEASMLFSYWIEEDVTNSDSNGYSYTAKRKTRKFQRVTLSIAFTDDGITASPTYIDEGTRPEWIMNRFTQTEKGQKKYPPPDWRGSLASPDCSLSVKKTAAYSGEDETRWSSQGSYEFLYPLALNYSSDGQIKVAYCKETYDKSNQYVYKGEIKGELGFEYEVAKHPSSGLCYVKTYWNIDSSTKIATISESNTIRYRVEVIIADQPVVAYELSGFANTTRSDTLVSYSKDKPPMFSIMEGTELSYTQDKVTQVNADGFEYLSIKPAYVDVLNSTFLIFVDAKKATASKIYTYHSAEHTRWMTNNNQNYPVTLKSELSDVGASTTGTTFDRRYLLTVNGEAHDAILSLKEGTQASDTNPIPQPNIGVGGNREYPYSDTFSSEYAVGIASYPNGCAADFSYVRDRRFPESVQPIWAYSIKCADGFRMAPFFENLCTFGPLADYLPKLDDEGKPTKEKLPGDKLTVYPIGLY